MIDKKSLTVEIIGDKIAPEYYVSGIGTVGKWDPLKKHIEIYHRKNEYNQWLSHVPETIKCTKKQAPTKIKSWLQL